MPYLLLAPFAVIILMVVLAAANVLIQSLGYIPAFDLYDITLDYYKDVLHRSELISALGVSIKVSLISSIGAAVIGTLVCAALVKLRKTRGGALYMVRLPILVPHTVVAVFTIALFAQTGLISRIAYALGMIDDFSQFPELLYTGSYAGVIIAYLWKEIPFIAYFVLALMSSINDSLGEASENLGASPVRSFFDVVLPLSMPAIAKSFLIVFIFSFGGFELPLLLGATLPKAMPVLTYLEFLQPNLKDRPYAMAMNGIMLIVSALMAIAYFLLMRRFTDRGEDKQ